jgi:hypothetical protein
VAIVLKSIPASSDTVESEGRQMKCQITYIKKEKTKKFPLKKNKSKKVLHLSKGLDW